jgi:RNA 2',3'-cyclic 3'-phosphodiesterase
MNKGPEKAYSPFLRLFVAVDLSAEAREAVAGEQQRIAAAMSGSRSSLKWVNPEQAHLTLVFLGNVDAPRVAGVVEAIGRDVDLAPFEMVLEGIGVFPSRGAPRVLWLGIAGGAPELTLLQREIAARAGGLGIALEDRRFSPHLTIGRWRESRPADRERAVGGGRKGALARVRVEAATLYESKLSPAGAAYTPLAHANLTPHSWRSSSLRT